MTDHSVHDFRPGDLVKVKKSYYQNGTAERPTYRVVRLVQSRDPAQSPCVVLERADRPRSTAAWGVFWLEKVAP